MTYWHYTCSHGRKGIGDAGNVISAIMLAGTEKFQTMPAWQRAVAEIIWLTDLDVPVRDALGLTSNTISCDRTCHRYRVTDYRPIRYIDIRRDLPRRLRDDLETAPGARPMHWWMAYAPVPVVYDPLPVSAPGVGGDR